MHFDAQFIKGGKKMLKRLFSLQLFGEGGDGGAAGAGATAGDNSGVEVPSSIPERARETYKRAMQKTRPQSDQPKPEAQTEPEPTKEEEKPAHIPYSELIKSEEYKAEHQEWANKAIGERLKKYKGIEETAARQGQLLGLIATKYGLDETAPDFLEKLEQSIGDDDSYYEKYAVEHDCSPTEARKIVTLERKLAQNEQAQRQAAQEEQRRRDVEVLRRNSERTKQIFPGFDLQTEMQNPQFAKICAATNGDTTAAYRAIHWQDIVPATVQRAQEQAVQQTANAIKANASRPVENGLNAGTPSVTKDIDFRGMSLAELRAYADEQRRKMK